MRSTKIISKSNCTKSEVRCRTNKYRKLTKCSYCQKSFANVTYYLRIHQPQCKRQMQSKVIEIYRQQEKANEINMIEIAHEPKQIIFDQDKVSVVEELKKLKIDNPNPLQNQMMQFQQRLSRLEMSSYNKRTMLATQSYLMWGEQANIIVENAFKNIGDLVKDRIVTALSEQATPETFSAEIRSRVTEHIINFMKGINLSGIITSWQQKVSKVVQYKTSEFTKLMITDSALRRYKIAAKFFSKYSQAQVCSQNIVILDLAHQSQYLIKSCFEFINLMINIGIAPPHLRPLPKKLLLKSKKSLKKPISIFDVRCSVLELLQSNQQKLACDIWMSACLGLRKSQLLRVKFIDQRTGNFADVIKIQEKKNANLTSRIIPSSLKKLILFTRTFYPITYQRFSAAREYSIKKFGSFYGLRHLCMTSIMGSLLKQSSYSFHSRPEMTLKHYINKEDYDLIDNVFSLDPTAVESSSYRSGTEMVFQLGKQPKFIQDTHHKVILTLDGVQKMLNQRQQEEQQEQMINNLIQKVGTQNFFIQYDAVQSSPMQIFEHYLKEQQKFMMEALIDFLGNPFKAFCYYFGVAVYTHILSFGRKSIFKYEPLSEQDKQNLFACLNKQQKNQLDIQPTQIHLDQQDEVFNNPFDAHFLKIQNDQDEIWMSRWIEKNSKQRLRVPQTLRKSKRIIMEEATEIRMRAPLCFTCKKRLRLATCQYHVNCQGLSTECQCIKRACSAKVFSGYLTVKPKILSSGSILDLECNKIHLNYSKNNIIDEIKKDKKEICRNFKWSNSLKQKIRFDLKIVSSFEEIQRIITEEDYLPLKIIQISQQKGKGVVATRTIIQNTLICSYIGQIRLHNQGFVDDDSIVSIGWTEDSEVSIYCQEKTNIGRYLNCCDSKNKANCKISKCLYPKGGDINNLELALIFMSTKIIAQGEQLLWDYGAGYWNRN